MEKPISIIIEEAKQKIGTTINELNLHPSILEPIMKDLYTEVQFLAKQQYEKDKKEYEESMKE